MKIEGHFNIIDYSLTHNILLLKTTQVVNSKPINTDLLFSSTYYLEIPAYFTDIEIIESTDADRDYVLSRCRSDFVSTLDKKDVFVFRTNQQTYYVGARRLEIYTNSDSPGETSIGLKRKIV